MKGYSKVIATSSIGAVETIDGKALEIASAVPDCSHWTIHEKDHQRAMVIVAIIPKDWVLRMVPNDVA